MSFAFLTIFFLPLVPLAIGLTLVAHITTTRRIPFGAVVRPFVKKVLSWEGIATAAFTAFVILATVSTSSPQGPLMLLFLSVPFSLGEFAGFPPISLIFSHLSPLVCIT